MSNLIKFGNLNNSSESARVLDMNELAQNKIAAYQARMQEQTMGQHTGEAKGFVSGLVAETLDVDALLLDDDSQGQILGVDTDAPISDYDEASGTAELDEATQNQIFQDVENQVREMLQDAQAQADEIINQALIEAQAQKEAIFANAQEEGFAAGQKEAMAKMQSMEAQLQERADALEVEFSNLLNALEPEMIDTLSSVYEYLFGVCLQDQKDILIHLIDQAMRRIENSHSFLVHVSTADYPYVITKKEELKERAMFPNSEIEIIEDFSLEKNACMIETDGGIFDCGLGTELSELSQKLKLLSFEKGR